MSWKIKVLKKEGLVSSVCTGLIDYYEIMQMFTESINTGKKYGISKLFADNRNSKHDLSIAEIYNIPVKLKNKGLDSEDKIAFLVSPESIESENLKYIELISDTKGLNLKLFTDEKRAFEWLK